MAPGGSVVLRVLCGPAIEDVTAPMAARLEALLSTVHEATDAHSGSLDLTSFGGGMLPPLKPPKAVNPKHLAAAQIRIASKAALKAAQASPHNPKLSHSQSTEAILQRQPPSLHGSSSTPALPAIDRPDPPHAITEERLDLQRHKQRLFDYDKQYTFGLHNFDDEMVTKMLHVDQEARLRPALVVQYGMQSLQFRDVHRADILSRLTPAAPEEILAQQMERRDYQRKIEAAPAGVCDTVPPSADALALMEELEHVDVLERLGDRAKRISSNPELIKSDRKVLDSKAGKEAKRKKVSTLFKLGAKRLSTSQLDSLRDLVGERALRVCMHACVHSCICTCMPDSLRDLVREQVYTHARMHACASQVRRPSTSSRHTPPHPIPSPLTGKKAFSELAAYPTPPHTLTSHR